MFVFSYLGIVKHDKLSIINIFPEVPTRFQAIIAEKWFHHICTQKVFIIRLELKILIEEEQEIYYLKVHA